MAGSDFTIANKIEVLPGNILLLPGCEPTSSFSSPTLARNMQCPASTISLTAALKAIPDATIVTMFNMNPKRKFFVLPEGPPPKVGSCCDGPPDYYQILRDAAGEAEPVPAGGCPAKEGFNYAGYCCGAA